MTKAELEAKVAELERDANSLAMRVATQRRDLADAEKIAESAEQRLHEKFRGLHLWDACNSTGSPLCLCGDNDEDGLSLNIFTVGENIVGVSVFTKGTGECVGEVGLVPAIPAADRV